MSALTTELPLPREADQAVRAVAKVVVMAPMAEALDYLIPDTLYLMRGNHVLVPLGHARVRGLVVGFDTRTDESLKLKPVLQKLDDPPVPDAALDFWLWAAAWTLTPPGVFLNGCLRALRVAKGQVRQGYVATGTAPHRMTKARARVIETAVLPMGLSDLAMAAAVSTGVVTALEKEGVLEKVDLPAADDYRAPDPDYAPANLNPGQAAAHILLRNEAAKMGFAPVLLDGVTGSGKTEVYLESVADILRERPDAQVLILLPEIALTQAVLGRLKARFGVEVAQWHANISNGSRAAVSGKAWRRAGSGWWSAPARPCSCRFRNSDLSSSMKSTTVPTNRKRVCVTTPATWLSSARARTAPWSSWRRRRRRSKP